MEVEPARVRFGPYELDRSSGELTKFGHKLRLQDQPFQILVLLLDRPGEVVTREQLQQKLWSSDTFVDFEHGLNNAIKRLREVLSDSAEKPRYVETLPRRGYRFVGLVEKPPAPEATLAPATPEAAETPKKQRIGPMVAVTLLVGVLVAAGFGIRPTLPVSRHIRSVAVLPLANLSGDPSQEYFADGVTEALTTELAQVGALRVVSRTSAMRYKNTKEPVSKIAQELNVDAVIEGSVSRQGDHIRVSAQLIQAASDRHLWAEKYDRKLGDVLTLESEVAEQIAQQVAANVTPEERSRLRRERTVNPQAYDLYLQAKFYLRQLNRADNDQAIVLLEKAVALDPHFALGYSALGFEYRTRAMALNRGSDDWDRKAYVAAERAVELDPDLADGYVSRAMVLWSPRNHFPHENAIGELKHALSLNPNSDEAHHELANIYNHIGLLDRAEEQVREAVALDPTNPGARFRISTNLIYQGKYEEALATIRASRDFMPSLWAYQTAFALVQLGRQQEAAQLMAVSEHKDRAETASLLRGMEAVLAASSGDRGAAEHKIAEAIRMGSGFQHFHHTEYAIGSAYALMNRPAEAVRWLRAAADDGFPCYPLYARDRNLQNLRGNAEFTAFMDELQREWQQRSKTL